MGKPSLLILPLVALLAGCPGTGGSDGGGPGISSIGRVKQYIVEFTTETGETIQRRAETLSKALTAIWRSVFPRTEDGVTIDPYDPLRGVLQGTYVLKVTSKDSSGKEASMKLHLTNPSMHRQSEEDPWEPDPSEYSPALQGELQAE